MRTRLALLLSCAAPLFTAPLFTGPLFTGPARAQQVPNPPAATALPEMVVTATRLPTPEESIPAGVTVITRAEIDQRGYTTLAEALADVPGVHIVQTGGPGGVGSLFVRGANSNQVLVLRDGMRVDDPSISDDAYNFGVDTLADVERIEIIRGPASGLYGSGAIGGVVNIITSRGEGAPHGSVTLGAGLPRADLAQGHLAGATGMLDYSLDLGEQSDLGFDATPKRETTVYTGQHDGARSKTAQLTLGLTPVEGTRFSLQLRGRATDYLYPDVAYPAFDDPDEVGHDTSVAGRLGADTTLLNGAWKTGLAFSALRDDRHYINLLDAADPNQATENSRYRGQRTELQWNNSIDLPEFWHITAPALTFGDDHTADDARLALNTNSVDGPYTQNLDAAMHSDAGHVGLQATAFDQLTLTANARAEADSGVGNALTWRAGAVYALADTGLRLKAAYGTAFRAPSLFDRYGIDDYGYVGNPDLRPERSSGWEAGAAYDFPHQWATLDVTFFQNRVHDLINTQFSPVYTEVNIGSARLQGVETTLTLRPAAWLDAVISYTYTDARDLDTGALLLRRPHDAAAFTLRAEPLPGLTIAPEIQYIGAFADQLVDDAGYPAGVGLARAGVLANVTVNWKATDKITVFAIMRNIGNAQYEPASGFAAPGRSVLAGTRLAF